MFFPWLEERKPFLVIEKALVRLDEKSRLFCQLEREESANQESRLQ